jgi:hypothetical protein
MLFAKGNPLEPGYVSDGVEGVPKEARDVLWSGALGAMKLSLAANMTDCFLQGVSGMCALGRPAFGSSTFRFFFEMRPVDMKAAGNGLAAL